MADVSRDIGWLFGVFEFYSVRVGVCVSKLNKDSFILTMQLSMEQRHCHHGVSSVTTKTTRQSAQTGTVDGELVSWRIEDNIINLYVILAKLISP